MSRFPLTPSTSAAWLAVLALGCFGCADGATEPVGTTGLAPAASVTAVTRPFKMTVDVAFVEPVVPPPAPCMALFKSELEGQATHLGTFTGTGSTCILIDMANPPIDPDPPCVPAGPGPYFTAPFTNPLWVLTAADGDELWLTAEDAFAVLSVVDGSLCADGVHRIIGGTGRFAGATGETHTTAINEDGIGPDNGKSEGWIRY